MADLCKVNLALVGMNFKPHHYTDPLTRPLAYFINMNIEIQLVVHGDT